ncbi:UDP-N-acetylmuramoyl-tripeptide--D-alanyl-D-alanine ligase [Fulvivirga sp. M361]|uniref:UDP-N-acetylmuramoyl-tripeptide--D-alanyl-D- alanine ligase n=1 Tax=Fulvivirga sp. M361 TaxID=2594266 RepID=UPI00117A6275|nr:UDP-N-acetylmuramoyl-tripeptide--D-alanyl-D-alanine ligase [Fulvivirga sp. M361]TRX51628.1 UDP-N-acetylmuramoyl-tripeptide--D-alanyl-D-alanine ligase [Fulvivirga sp. M361]
MIAALYQHFLDHPEVCTDTRRIAKGSVFFALKGPNFDANAFAAEALYKGAALAVVDDPSVVKDDRYFLVEDVLKALQDLARHHRDQLKIPVIGLTGSNGKTTTKELINVVLSTRYLTVATHGNLNNHIGVPLTILSIKPEHEMAIVEMGANHVGEIALLSSIAKPSHGLITNIGKAHLEGFGGIEGVIRGKSELYQHLIQCNGVVWINSHSHELSNMAKRFEAPLMYPDNGDYYHCELVGVEPFLKVKNEEGDLIQTQLTGKYNFDNIASAMAIGKYFEVTPAAMATAIANYSPQNMRSQIIERGSNTIILDAYNANPDSMAAALENLSLQNAQRKVVVLGDMMELGEDCDKEHRNLGHILNDMKPDTVFLCGEFVRITHEEVADSFYFNDRKGLMEHLQTHPIKDSLILIKASRSIGLEQVVDHL